MRSIEYVFRGKKRTSLPSGKLVLAESSNSKDTGNAHLEQAHPNPGDAYKRRRQEQNFDGCFLCHCKHSYVFFVSLDPELLRR